MKNSKKIEEFLLVFTLAGEILSAVLFHNKNGSEIIATAGWLVLCFSAYLGWAPINILRYKGKVKEEKNFVHTTQIVTTGIYALVRHPQYLAGILFSISIALIAQHFLVIFLALVNCAIFIFSTYDEDKFNISKFGAGYQNYMIKVPRLNILYGLVKLLKKPGDKTH